jgi:RNA polymerase sigma factor (sigma-70 family)
VIDDTWQVDQFERARPQLRAVAYRMLGSLSDADDAVQEAWLRLHRSDDEAIRNMDAWLTTVVGRVCIDMLRARQSRREAYVGTWLPEPVVSDDAVVGPEQEALLGDAVGLALLVVLDTLTPAERLSFVLHDMFSVPFEDIAAMLDRSPTAARQLASRARRRVRAAPAPDVDLVRQREVVTAFLAAARAGDFDALLEVLDPDVVFRVDTGDRPDLAAGPLRLDGAVAVARQTAEQGPRFAPHCRVALVNGAAGIVVRSRDFVLGVAGMSVVDGRITTVDIVLDPAKLAGLQPPV